MLIQMGHFQRISWPKLEANLGTISYSQINHSNKKMLQLDLNPQPCSKLHPQYWFGVVCGR